MLFMSIAWLWRTRWNDIDRQTPANSEKNLSQYRFVHNKLHMDWRGCEPGPPLWEVGEYSPEPWHGLKHNYPVSSLSQSMRTLYCWKQVNNMLYLDQPSNLVNWWLQFSGINQSVSCNFYLEHRASATHRHRTATFTPFQFRPAALASIWTDLLQMLFGRPFVLNFVGSIQEPFGLHRREVSAMYAPTIIFFVWFLLLLGLEPFSSIDLGC
jgi:hypothetical protein